MCFAGLGQVLAESSWFIMFFKSCVFVNFLPDDSIHY